MKISLVMIVKDEASRIERCLNSVRPIIDEFVIVDTGSTDHTGELIEQITGVKPHERPWVDFVTCKNQALDLATGDYILFMDADMWVAQGLDRLRAHAEAGVDSVMAPIIEGFPQTAQKYYMTRLWRHRPEHRFVGTAGIHETIVTTGATVRDANILIGHDHAGKDSAYYHAKFQQHVIALEAWLVDHPRDTRAVYYLARTYESLNLPLRAAETFERYLAMKSGFLDECWDAAYHIAECYRQYGEYDLAIEALERAIQIDPRRAEAHYALGSIYFQQQFWERAAQCYERAIVRPIPGNVILFVDPTKYDSDAKEQLAICYDKLRRFRKAKQIYDTLYVGPQTDQRQRNNLAWIHAQLYKTWFFTLGHTPEAVYGSMLEQQGIGGVETTYIELPIELAKLGHTVFVFMNCDKPHVYQNVNFVPYGQIADYLELQPDVIVTSRWLDALYLPGTAQAKKIVWLQDAHFADPNHPDVWRVADAVVVSSRWHAHYCAQRLGHQIPLGHLHLVPLSIRKELYAAGIVERDPLQMIYSSNPDRGLWTLMDMWAELTSRVPGIHLKVTYGWEGLRTWDARPEWQAKCANDQARLEHFVTQYGNIVATGRLKKADLAFEQLRSTLWLYPCNFWETFCLTGLEMQMAGVPTITTRMGALSTTLDLGCNVLLRLDPYSPDYKRNFISATLDLLEHRDRLAVWRDASIKFAAVQPSWNAIAQTWEQIVFDCGS